MVVFHPGWWLIWSFDVFWVWSLQAWRCKVESSLWVCEASEGSLQLFGNFQHDSTVSDVLAASIFLFPACSSLTKGLKKPTNWERRAMSSSTQETLKLLVSATMVPSGIWILILANSGIWWTNTSLTWTLGALAGHQLLYHWISNSYY